MRGWKRIRTSLIFLWTDASSIHFRSDMNETRTLYLSGAELAQAVPPREYNRLLQLPKAHELEGDLLDRAQQARSWYEQHGHPFVAFRRVAVHEVSDSTILLEDDVQLSSLVLAQRLKAGESQALMILAATAGHEVSKEVTKHWKEGRPDEGFFLDRFAVGVTERLLFWTAATICRESEEAHETLMPHLSPGCGNWDLTDQNKLMNFLAGETNTIGPIRMFESGGLDPAHSVLAAMGVTNRRFANTPEYLCRTCDLDPCEFRRAPFGGEIIRELTAKAPRRQG